MSDASELKGPRAWRSSRAVPLMGVCAVSLSMATSSLWQPARSATTLVLWSLHYSTLHSTGKHEQLTSAALSHAEAAARVAVASSLFIFQIEIGDAVPQERAERFAYRCLHRAAWAHTHARTWPWLQSLRLRAFAPSASLAGLSLALITLLHSRLSTTKV